MKVSVQWYIYSVPAHEKIGIAPEVEMEEELESMQEDIVFYTRSERYRAVEVSFANEQVVFAHAPTTFNMGE